MRNTQPPRPSRSTLMLEVALLPLPNRKTSMSKSPRRRKDPSRERTSPKNTAGASNHHLLLTKKKQHSRAYLHRGTRCPKASSERRHLRCWHRSRSLSRVSPSLAPLHCLYSQLRHTLGCRKRPASTKCHEAKNGRVATALCRAHHQKENIKPLQHKTQR